MRHSQLFLCLENEHLYLASCLTYLYWYSLSQGEWNLIWSAVYLLRVCPYNNRPFKFPWKMDCLNFLVNYRYQATYEINENGLYFGRNAFFIFWGFFFKYHPLLQVNVNGTIFLFVSFKWWIAKRASDVMTQIRLGQTNWNGGWFWRFV